MAVISIPITVSKNILSDYTEIKIYRSTEEDGTYAEITAAEVQQAFTQGADAGPFFLASKVLNLDYCGVIYGSIIFDSSMDNVGSLRVARILDQQFGHDTFLFYADDGKVGIGTARTGGSFSFQLSGTACVELGLSTDRVFGRWPRLPLYGLTVHYEFKDWGGSPDFWYKVSFYNHNTLAESDLSDPIPGEPHVRFPTEGLSLAHGIIVGLDGKPIHDRLVRFEMMSPPLSGTSLTYGTSWVMPDTVQEVFTDHQGYFETNLPIGAQIKFSVEGSRHVRVIMVPDEEEFDVFALAAPLPDNYVVQEPEETLLIRRS